MQRRKHERRSITLRGTMLTSGSKALIGCTIRNISEDGALLEAKGLTSVPAIFDLLIHYPDGTILRRRCKVVRHAGNQVGVSFQ